MVRILDRRVLDDGAFYIDGACKSTDTKPTRNIATGSCMIEVDTGDAYLYDEDSTTWIKVGGGNE